MHVGYALVNFRFRTCGLLEWHLIALLSELFVSSKNSLLVVALRPIFFRRTKIRCAITGNGYLLITENGYLFSLNYRHGAFCGGRLAFLELASLW